MDHSVFNSLLFASSLALPASDSGIDLNKCCGLWEKGIEVRHRLGQFRGPKTHLFGGKTELTFDLALGVHFQPKSVVLFLENLNTSSLTSLNLPLGSPVLVRLCVCVFVCVCVCARVNE